MGQRVMNQRLLFDRDRYGEQMLPSILPRKEQGRRAHKYRAGLRTELTALYRPTDLSQLADKADDRPDKAEKFADPTVVQIWGDTSAQAVSIVHLAETELGRTNSKFVYMWCVDVHVQQQQQHRDTLGNRVPAKGDDGRSMTPCYRLLLPRHVIQVDTCWRELFIP
ncbi:uncharacterized protein B0T23DRAFT_398139 [Neurospora hispaniola]|uniref:Uncharacterized protein n=1 Tax=Neurospora hispaniola TaxID=588809 RepID=A0AAJ0MNE4_9PEZI|nr:hypothetical protein B0T23DRAFT_398139 [Neurospora hispaniola]